MDVLITMTREPEVAGNDIFIWFLATIRESDGKTHQLPFKVVMGWGASIATKRSAILTAGQTEADSYFASLGRTTPVVARIEILGV